MFQYKVSEKKEQLLKQHLDMAHGVRMKAAQKSSDADKKAIRRQGSKFPHSVYTIRDRELVKTNKKKWNKVKGKGVAIQNEVQELQWLQLMLHTINTK